MSHQSSAALKEKIASLERGQCAALVVSCEHGGNDIPARYRDLFHGCQDLLDSHRGFDAGALVMARELASAFDAPLVSATVSRLLVDLNRSTWHPQFHFEAVRQLPESKRRHIVEHYYQPYRARAETLVRQAITERGRVVHIASHSFTPELNGERRKADIGLLYDPGRPGEVALCQRWKAALKRCAPQLTVRRNYPYEGKSDGLTARLRKCHSPDIYVGVELEINQKHAGLPAPQWAAIREAIITSLGMALAGQQELTIR